MIVELNFQNLTILDQVLLPFSEDEFKLKRKLFGDGAFVGNITKEGLDKLIDNPEVRIIYLNRILQVPENNETDRKQARRDCYHRY